jgi:hypothetical protein
MSVIALSSSDWVKSVEATVGIADYLSMVCSRDSLRVDDTASIEPQAATATAPRTAPAQHPHLGSPQFSFGLWAARAGVKMKIRPIPVTRPRDDTRTPTGCGLLATGPEQCRNAVEACSQSGSPAVGEAWGVLRLPGSKSTDDTPGADQ